ncbi:CBS domain-containing protein [Pedococcus sp. KACC 23699]|uniref:CBS domain-containing protein n=1 Tax=Pedococcus sp. KACC 23699 TaxID=3149228 RepID=A0AAU7JSJ6_9MICO
MLVREIMTVPAYSLPLGSTLEAAIQLLARAHLSALPVVDGDHRVVGIVSEADILRLQLTPDPRAHLRPVELDEVPWPRLVDEVMTPDPVTVLETADVAELGQLLADTGWKSVPVVRDRVLVAMVSRSDILRAMTTSDSAIRRHLTREFAALGRARWSVSVAEGEVTVTGTRGGREARLAHVMASAVPGVRRVVVAASSQPAAATDRPAAATDRPAAATDRPV